MGVYKVDEIAGYTYEDGIFCPDCMSDEDLNETLEDQVITRAEVEQGDVIYFCDECGKRLL